MSSILPNGIREVHPGELRIGRFLSGGSFGLVRLGFLDGQEVAIKELRNATIKKREKFRTELEFLGIGRWSPYIVQLLGGVVDDKGCSSVVMEFCNGGDLDSYVKRADANKNELLAILDDAKNGILYLHERAIVHRDVKPHNIFIKEKTPNTRMKGKLGDFGLMIRLPEDGKLRVPCGTRYYMAPEVIAEEQYDRSADIFSFGITTIDVFTELDASLQKPGWIDWCCDQNPKNRPLINDFIICEACQYTKEQCPWGERCWFDHTRCTGSPFI